MSFPLINFALVGTAYATPAPGPAYFVWTDVYPNPVLGDVDGNGIRGEHDAMLIADWVATTCRNLADASKLAGPRAMRGSLTSAAT